MDKWNSNDVKCVGCQNTMYRIPILPSLPGEVKCWCAKCGTLLQSNTRDPIQESDWLCPDPVRAKFTEEYSAQCDAERAGKPENR